ncbi:MAG: serine hydrolase [Epsilonproteobacteria bacterium]|nr:serine hydrolase [Campylobacterota bacterium]
MILMKTIGLCLSLSIAAYAGIDKRELDGLKVGALVVKDLKTKHILYAKDGDKRVSPASLTKVMTVILAIQSNKMNEAVTITREMTQVKPTIAGYKRGDVVLMSDLVKAAMIKSDNDAAKAIAIAVGGDEERFVALMNSKARQIGMRNTHFSNPCGYDGKEQYSSPNDLLKMTEYAIKSPIFNAISKLNNHTYYALNKGKLKQFTAYTHNRLLNRYEYAVGVKTGFTNKAGACLIARAKKDGKDCLIVMMNSKVDRWKTAKQIFEQVLNS